MTWLEIGAALFGVVSVWLSTRENIWSWPTAIVNVGLYTVVFFQSRLYADMGLQVVYLLLSVYGWYQWLYGGAQHTALTVSRAPRALLAVLLGINLLAWLALATALDRHTDAVLPWLDSLLTTTSLVAQWMMTRKLLENWLIWIAVDIVYVPMFIARQLYPTAALYAVFLGLAVIGYRDWRRSWRRHAGGA
ncbi:MAG: nicotinamide mononucleotide transporter [Gemmatimonadaceae bacterium]|nr:nicotinamide mononucleotide transporter [Gemmatimonadaceae bacterium]